MNYARIYDDLMRRSFHRELSGYVERHHIIPRCMGGGDEPENIAILTPEEHFLAHLLLVKIHPSHHGLALAAGKMCVSSRSTPGRVNRKMYGWLRRRHAAAMSHFQSGERNSQHGSRWIHNGQGESRKSKEPPPEGWFYGKVSKEARVDARHKRLKDACPSCGELKYRRSSLCKGCSPNPSAGRYKVSDEELLNALILHDWRYPTAFKSVGLSIGSNYKRARKLEEIHRGMV